MFSVLPELRAIVTPAGPTILPPRVTLPILLNVTVPPTTGAVKFAKVPVLLMLALPVALTVRLFVIAVARVALPPEALTARLFAVITPEALILPAVAISVVVSFTDPTAPLRLSDAPDNWTVAPLVIIALALNAPPTSMNRLFVPILIVLALLLLVKPPTVPCVSCNNWSL